ncbi:hypothetical protein HNP46_004197 [Pseudomonas nitritireducens]|uniref:Uncharacterized protein n=1 Tax=Pseudomonas nitroreducens TaxID=46680 RepID=A0A7W7KM40_PSENT|nr:hypothetical protein [Pseudomonas nitritireducens]MBB4865316.1 hypothetical protein [Pseudomonas nitritireducens]
MIGVHGCRNKKAGTGQFKVSKSMQAFTQNVQRMALHRIFDNEAPSWHSYTHRPEGRSKKQTGKVVAAAAELFSEARRQPASTRPPWPFIEAKRI